MTIYYGITIFLQDKLSWLILIVWIGWTSLLMIFLEVLNHISSMNIPASEISSLDPRTMKQQTIQSPDTIIESVLKLKVI